MGSKEMLLLSKTYDLSLVWISRTMKIIPHNNYSGNSLWTMMMMMISRHRNLNPRLSISIPL